MDEAFLKRIKEAKGAINSEDIKTTKAIMPEDKTANKRARTIAQKKILEMRTEGCSYADIAKEVRYPISTVRDFWIKHPQKGIAN